MSHIVVVVSGGDVDRLLDPCCILRVHRVCICILGLYQQ